MDTKTRQIHDKLTQIGESAFQEFFEKFKQETLPLGLKRKAVQERLERLAKETETTNEPADKKS